MLVGYASQKRLSMSLFSRPHLLLRCPSSVAGYCEGRTSGPPCCLPAVFLAGLLEPKDVDSIGPLQCRPRLGPRHGAEGFYPKDASFRRAPYLLLP